MRTKLLLFILLSFLISENEKTGANLERGKILEKKEAYQAFIVPTEIETLPEWKILTDRHKLELFQLRTNSKKLDRSNFRNKFLEVRKRHKEEKYQLFKKLKQ